MSEVNENSLPLRVLFLSSDTGGGHRASAESLGAQFQRLFPGSTYELLDIVKEHGTPPYNGLETWYQHLSSNPTQWNLVYKLSNSRPMETILKTHLKLTTERSVRKRIKSHEPDVVISVHPLMTNVPVFSCAKISSETGKHLPMFTVVTDLGSGHCTWFDQGVEKMFIASDQIKELAMKRGKVPEDKLVMTGLPIRHDFAVQAASLTENGRTSLEGKIHQLQVREKLGIINAQEETYRKVILVMGGGEGVGSLSSIVDALYIEFVSQLIPSVILVVCGRNTILKESLEKRDWNGVYMEALNEESNDHQSKKNITAGIGSKINGFASRLHPLKMLSRIQDNDKEREDEHPIEENGLDPKTPQDGHVLVQPLGFVTNMAEYMVAADLLVSKAGPGTIAEAASLGLPVMLTSFLPGQEEGNVDFVIEKKFGDYKPDTKPKLIANASASWLRDPDLMTEMSRHAQDAGNPQAAENIVKQIGKSALRWKELHVEEDGSLSGIIAE